MMDIGDKMETGKRSEINEYWQRPTDTKKLVIRYLTGWWLVLAGAVLGIALGAGIYMLYHAATDGVKYEAYSQFYLSFAPDESGEAYQYYNGYTWNELMTTDLVAEGTLARLEGSGIDLAKLESVTLAEIKSDIRVLRVTFTDEDEQICARIQSATEGSLEELGATAPEFIQIETIKSVAPARVYADDRIKQAMLLGAILGTIAAMLCLWFKTILEDKVMTVSDISPMSVPVLGIEFSSGNGRLRESVERLCRTNAAYMQAKADIGENAELERIDINTVIEGYPEDFDRLRALPGIVLEVPYGKVSKGTLELGLAALELQDCRVIGIIITKASEGFYRLYLAM